jgi:glycosyltransferase involved in cell wall biosynthesis
VIRSVFVTTSFPDGPEDPAGHFVRTEAMARARAGEEVLVVAPGPTRARRRDGDLTVLTLPGGDAFGWPGVAARLTRAPWRAAAAAQWVYVARDCIAHLAPDHVHAHWVVPCAWPIANGAKRRGARVFGVSHGADVRLLLAMPRVMRVRAVSALCDSLDTWRFVSETLLGSLLAALPTDVAARVEAISAVAPALIDVPRVDAGARAEKRARVGASNVVSVVGRLTPKKRVDRAIDYARERGAGTHLVVVGDGPERERLERYAARAGVAATFVGHATRSEAVAWIAASDELVIASSAEGLSTVAREAEALGIRVTRL